MLSPSKGPFIIGGGLGQSLVGDGISCRGLYFSRSAKILATMNKELWLCGLSPDGSDMWWLLLSAAQSGENTLPSRHVSMNSGGFPDGLEAAIARRHSAAVVASILISNVEFISL